MAVTGETLRIAAGLKLTLDTAATQAEQELVRAWAAAWNVLLPDWTDALREASESVYDGQTTWRAWARAERARRALRATLEQMQVLAAQTGVTITGRLPDILAVTATAHEGIVASQLPSRAVLAVDWARVDERALDAIVRRTTRQVTARTRPISRDATRAIRETLVRGVAAGMNPRNAAREMLARTRGQFAGGLTRALVISRTELLDAHRAAAHEADKAAADVLDGWVWQATLSSRTCPSCLAMHGTVHPLSEPGPIDHPQGRCTRLPAVKSWADLGLDVPEPEPVVQDARAWFAAQDEATQVQIMGRDRLALLRSGRVGWDDLPQRRVNPDWRDSIQVRPLKDLQAKAA